MRAYIVIFRSNVHKLAYRNIGLFFFFFIITSDNDILSEVIIIRKLGLNGPIPYVI